VKLAIRVRNAFESTFLVLCSSTGYQEGTATVRQDGYEGVRLAKEGAVYYYTGVVPDVCLRADCVAAFGLPGR